MRKPNGYWTYEKCKNEYLKYRNVSSFKINNKSAYNKAVREGWLKEFSK